MDEKNLNEEIRVAIDHPDGGTVWLPASKVEAWRRGQEKLKQGDPEALKRLEQWRSELLKRLDERMR